MMPREEIHADRNVQIRNLRRQGVGPREIARRLGTTPNVVAGVLHRAGMCDRAMGRGSGYPEDFRERVRTDRRAGLTYAQLAEKWGIDKMTAWTWVSGFRAGERPDARRRRRAA